MQPHLRRINSIYVNGFGSQLIVGGIDFDPVEIRSSDVLEAFKLASALLDQT